MQGAKEVVEQAQEEQEVEEASPRQELDLVKRLEKECLSWQQEVLGWCQDVVEVFGKHQSHLEQRVKGWNGRELAGRQEFLRAGVEG